MKNIVIWFGSAISIFFWLTPASAVGEETATEDQASIIAEARVIAEAYYKFGWFSGSVLLARDGNPIYQASFGMADRESETANHQRTKYNLGSIMKNYTAVLVLQQVENGAISLDDKLESFDLGFPPDVASKISVDHLLHHRSGFADIFIAEYRENQLAFDTIAKRLELLKDAPLLFEPGSEDHYSNYGYVVLGAILENVTSKSFETLLQQNIFDRLGLEDSVYPYRVNTTNQSLRYTFNYAGEQVLVGVTEHHGPDGGIEATAADVLTFYRAVFHSDKLLSPSRDAIREYFTIDEKHWDAFGGGAGVSAAAELDLINNYEIIVLANSDNLVAEEITGRIYSYIESGSYDPIILPPHVYAWKRYQEMGAESFKSDFVDRYKSDGYTQFIGRTLNELGMSLLKASRWNEALDIFNTLAGLFPDAPQVYDSLAFAFLSMGDTETAAQTFRKAIVLQSDFSSDYDSNDYGEDESN
jgi:CubicO group peptidase (beta-lactamase class C family)